MSSGNIVGLPEWLIDVKKTTYLSTKKKGVGAIRKIVFADGNVIEEHVIAWNDKESFTYIATEGLPLRVYSNTKAGSLSTKKFKTTCFAFCPRGTLMPQSFLADVAARYSGLILY